MKKNLLVLGFVFSLNAFSQTQPGFLDVLKKQIHQNTSTHKTAAIINLKDSSYAWTWDLNTSDWASPIRTTYSYNPTYTENASLTSSLIGSVWYDLSKTINYVYDGNNNLLSQTMQYWNGFAWANLTKTTNTYNASNNLVSALSQSWNPVTLGWENASYIVLTYDASNNLVTEISQLWDVGTSAWVNSTKFTATYNVNNETTGQMTQNWNTTTSVWENSSREINFVYLNGDLISYESQIWNSTTLLYEPDYKITITYDAGHRLLNTTTQNWNNTTSVWENGDKTDFTYDGNGNQITLLSQTWDAATSAWVNSFRMYNYYSTFVGVKEMAAQKENINVFPNPVSNFITISNEKITFSEITIVDVTGKIILTEEKSQTNSTTINVSKLETGIYFIEFKNGNYKIYKKFIKN